MEIEVQVVSKETIKPPSPTPKSLQRYQLSRLDQIAPPIFVSVVYFYQSDSKIIHSEISNHLKKSLSEALSRFYPLAGRLVGNLYVDCADQGAPFVEAEANCNLSEVVSNPIHMNKFIPNKVDDAQNLTMTAQITFFRCGGIAVGLMISHKIADASSLFLFASTWAAVARNENSDDLLHPKFEAAAIFPPRDFVEHKLSTETVEEELVTKIFTFPASKISALQERYSGGERRPTRLEALSAFIWTRLISILEVQPNPNMIYTVIHAVNLRTRVEPPLSKYHFGNICRAAIASPSIGDGGFELSQKVGEAIRATSGDCVALVKEVDEHLDVINEESIAEAINEGRLVLVCFTSWCRFPVYEADFGWGKPIWVGSATSTGKNMVIFMDTARGDGIEAYINLGKEDMEKFEVDLELQGFLA